MRTHGNIVAVLVLGLLAGCPAFPQTTFGSIRGRVLDPTGAAIPRVNVVVTNVGMGTARTVVSDDAGAYEAGYLQPGAYAVRVDATGFKSFASKEVILSANAIILVDAHLTVGEVSSTVEVTGGAPLIATETAAVSDVKTQQQYLQAPLNVRGDWDSFLFNFMSLVPGTQPTSNLFSISFAGTRFTMNNFTVDGISTNSTLFGNIIGPANPSMEFVHEVKVDLSGNSAEFGAPGHVSVVTKGGGNNFHGSLVWYYNTGGLNARSFFANRVGFSVLNDYGWSLSGPVFKNRTFFSTSMEGFNQRYSTLFNLVLPTDRMRQGDFSRVGAVVRDPYTNQPFAGNVIPASRLNPAALKTQSRFFPNVNFGDPEGLAANFRDQARNGARKEQIDIRIDHQFSSRNFLFGRFDAMRAPNATWSGNLPTIGPIDQRRQTRNFVVSDTHTFGPSTVNEFRFGMVRGYNPSSGPIYGPKVVQEMGLTNLPSDLPDVNAVPIVSISNFPQISQNDYSRSREMIFQWQDNMSWIKGRHTLKFGGELWWNYASRQAASPSRAYGTIAFSGTYTGYSYADFLLGIPRTASRISTGYDRYKTTNWDKFLFIHDDFKLSSRLTLNFGLRYELNSPYADELDRLNSFNPFTGRLVVPTENSRKWLAQGFLASNLVPIVTAQEAGLPTRTLVRTDKNNFAPRFGFAYKLTGDNLTVVRGAYGVYYDTFSGQIWRTMLGGPYQGSENSPVNTIVDGAALWTWPDIFPRATSQTGTASLSGLDPNLRTPYMQQWTLTLERQWMDMGLRATYVGSKTHKLVQSQNFNQLYPGLTAYSPSRRLYPALSSATWRSNQANAYYNALILVAERKFKSGLQYQLSHTWAKNLTDSHDENEVGGPLENAYNRRAEWGNHQYTRRHRFVVNAIWELPVGQGHRYLKSGIASHILGGWSLSTFGLFQTGPYFTPSFSGFDPANVGASGGRPDRIGSGMLSNPTIDRWFDKSAFAVPGDTNADGKPEVNVGRFGNCGVNILEGPGTRSVNAGVFKAFRIRERYKLQAEATFTNAFNHPNFAAPNTAINAAAGGVVSSVQSMEGAGSRTTRLGLRMDF